MKKMKPETLISMLNKRGIRIFNRNGELCGQGGGVHNMKASHPVMQLIKTHISELDQHLGTTA